MRRPAAGDTRPSVGTANLPTRHLCKAASHAIRLSNLATMSSPVTHRSTAKQVCKRIFKTRRDNMKARNQREVTPSAAGVAKLAIIGTIEIATAQRQQLLPLLMAH